MGGDEIELEKGDPGISTIQPRLAIWGGYMKRSLKRERYAA